MHKYADVGANEHLALLQEIWTQDDARPHARRREWIISKETADSNWFKPTQHNPTYAPITKSEHQYEHIPHHSSAPSGGSGTCFSNPHGSSWKLKIACHSNPLRHSWATPKSTTYQILDAHLHAACKSRCKMAAFAVDLCMHDHQVWCTLWALHLRRQKSAWIYRSTWIGRFQALVSWSCWS